MIHCFAPVEYYGKISQNIRSSGCRLQFGGAENRLAAIALQNPSTESCHALRAIQQLCF
jgi:hypothetical protein